MPLKENTNTDVDIVETLNAIECFTTEKNRLEALINHLKGPGGRNYDSAPPHVFLSKHVPQNLSQKSAADFLKEYENLLKETEKALQNAKSQLDQLLTE